MARKQGHEPSNVPKRSGFTRSGPVPPRVERSKLRHPCPVGQTEPPMRLVVATRSVDYQGRLTARLPAARRLILVKADGSVSVHSDGGAYMPLGLFAKNRLAGAVGD